MSSRDRKEMEDFGRKNKDKRHNFNQGHNNYPPPSFPIQFMPMGFGQGQGYPNFGNNMGNFRPGNMPGNMHGNMQGNYQPMSQMPTNPHS